MIVHYLSWRWIFLINVPVCIAAGVMSSYYFRNYKAKTRVPFDFPGFILLGGTASLLLSGIANLERITSESYIPLGLFSGSLLCALTFLWHARRVTHPLINLNLFRNPSYRLATIATIPLRSGVSAFAFVMPLILQILMGYSSLVTGLLMGAAAVGALLSRTVVHPLIKARGFRGVLVPCTILLAAATLASGFVWLSSSLVVVTLLILLTGFIRSLVFTTSNAASYGDLAKDLVSSGVSFSSLVQQLSISLAVGVAAAVLNIRQTLSHESILTGPDFIWLSVGTGLFTLIAMLLFWFLPAHLGKNKVEELAEMNP